MKLLKLVAAITALTASVNVNAAGAIDLFTAPTGETLVSVSTLDGVGSTDFIQVNDNDDPGSILGGYRDMEVKLLAEGTSPSQSVSMTTYNGVLSFSNGSGVTGKGTLQWDGDDSAGGAETLDTTGLGGIDLLELGNAFSFEVITADHDFDFSIGLYDMNGGSVVFDLAANQGTHTATDIAFSYFSDAFNPQAALGGLSVCDVFGIGSGGFDVDGGHVNHVICSGTSLDLSNIGAIETVINTNGGTAEVQLTIGSITAVPEPSSLALIGLGLMATGFASKRKSNKA